MIQQVISNCICGNDLIVPLGYSHARCEACLNYWFPTSIEQSEDGIVPQSRKTPFSCPRCVVDLEVGKIANAEVCFCPTCRGFVIDNATLGVLIRARRHSFTGRDDVPMPPRPSEIDVQGMCPACFSTLDAHHYGGPGNIVIDSCIHCKLAWLDHGELAKIIRAPGVR